jgi:hypothetical protein
MTRAGILITLLFGLRSAHGVALASSAALASTASNDVFALNQATYLGMAPAASGGPAAGEADPGSSGSSADDGSDPGSFTEDGPDPVANEADLTARQLPPIKTPATVDPPASEAPPSSEAPPASELPTTTSNTPSTTFSFAVISNTADCSEDVEACDEGSNSDPNRIVCYNDGTGAAFCQNYCQTVIGNTPEVLQYGLSSTCIGEGPVGGDPNAVVPGACVCSSAKFEADALIAIGETACIAVDVAISAAATIISDVGKFSGVAPLKWAGKLLQFGDTVLAQGAVAGDCPNSACPGHQFVVVDPNDLENQLGALDQC